MPEERTGARDGDARRLVDVLRALPAGELEALASRVGAELDPRKRIDEATQLARQLAGLPELRDAGRLAPPSSELLHRVAEASGRLVLPTLTPAAEPLLARGVLFARAASSGVELVLPIAHLVQLRPWEGEDPRGLRALLAQVSSETLAHVAAQYLGRPAVAPVILAVEAAFLALEGPRAIARELDKLSPAERRLLFSVARDGGEVETDELLDLDREPLRLRVASGVLPSLRGPSLVLERRALLLPLAPNRHVVPSEVVAVLDASHHEERAQRRAKLRAFVKDNDHAPLRARFAIDPGPLAAALALSVRDASPEVRAGVGTPRSLVQRLAARFGRDPSHVAVVATLSRAIGLWDVGAGACATPPGSLPVAGLSGALFGAWRLGGAWDEARADPEVLRLPEGQRETSPIGGFRQLVCDALLELALGGWVPLASLVGFIATDPRHASYAHRLRRWGARTSAEHVELLVIAQRIVTETFVALGVVDVGVPPNVIAGSQGIDADGMVVRLTARGRELLAARLPPAELLPSTFAEGGVLRVGGGALVGAVLGVAPFVEIAAVGDALSLHVTPQTIARAISSGIDADAARARLASVAPLSPLVAQALSQASVVVGRASYAASNGFLWVDDASVRELLRTRRGCAELFVDPSPPGGLLVQPGVELDRLARRARSLGVEIVAEGQVVRARSVPPPR